MGDDALDTIVIQPKKSHSATVIFMHGLGDRAENLTEWVRFLLGRDFHISGHVKIIFPTAPRQPFHVLGGKVLNVWFDANGNTGNIDQPEKKGAYSYIDRLLDDLIQQEVQLGIPLERIAVGGFSMGGCMALHVGFRTHRKLAAVFALSVYVNYDTAIYHVLEADPPSSASPAPELLMFHGDRDDLIRYEWGRYSHRELTRLGVRGEFHTMRGIKHEMRLNELLYVEQWIRDRLPALPGDLLNKL